MHWEYNPLPIEVSEWDEMCKDGCSLFIIGSLGPVVTSWYPDSSDSAILNCFTSSICLHYASLHIWIQLIIKLVCRFSRYNFCPCAILFPFIWIMGYFQEKLSCNLSKVCANAVRLIIWARVVFMDRFASYCDSIGTDLFSFNYLNTFSQRGHWYDVVDNEVTLWKYNSAFLQ